MTDLLTQWWIHPVSVKRWLGAGEAGGDSFADPVTVTGFYSDKTEFSSGEVFASGRFAFPSTVPYVPVKSQITLPAEFGDRVVRVVASSVGDGGSLTPNHQELAVL